MQFTFERASYTMCYPQCSQHQYPKQRSQAPVAVVVASVSSMLRKVGLPRRLDESLLRRNLEDRVQLEPGRGQLLLGGPIVALSLPLPPRQHQEDEEADHHYEGHASHDRPNYQGQFFC